MWGAKAGGKREMREREKRQREHATKTVWRVWREAGRQTAQRVYVPTWTEAAKVWWSENADTATLHRDSGSLRAGRALRTRSKSTQARSGRHCKGEGPRFCRLVVGSALEPGTLTQMLGPQPWQRAVPSSHFAFPEYSFISCLSPLACQLQGAVVCYSVP